MDTLAEQLDALHQSGFVHDFNLTEDGQLSAGDIEIGPHDVAVVHEFRFEGMSNPDDLSMLLALEGRNGDLGTLVLPYGPDLSGPQADAVRTLMVDRG